MVRSHEKERMKSMIKDTLMLLVKNGLSFNVQFSIEALIGITVDQDDIMLLSVNEIIQAKSQQKKVTKRPATDKVSDSDSEEEEDIVCVSEEKLPPKKPRIERSRAETRTHEKSFRSEQSGKSPSVNDKSSVGVFRVHSQRTSKVESPAYNVKTEVVEIEDIAAEKSFTKPLPEKVQSLPLEIQSGIGEVPTNGTLEVVDVTTDDSYCGVTDRSPRVKSEIAEVEIDWSSFSNVMAESSLPSYESQDPSIFSSSMLTPGGADLLPGASSHQAVGYRIHGVEGESLYSNYHRRRSKQEWSGSQLSPVSSAVTCKTCGKSYNNKMNLQRHEKSHDSSLIMCKKCTQFFSSQENYEIHVSMKHGGMEKKHVCTWCGKTYRRIQHLQRHVESCDGRYSLEFTAPGDNTDMLHQVDTNSHGMDGNTNHTQDDHDDGHIADSIAVYAKSDTNDGLARPGSRTGYSGPDENGGYAELDKEAGYSRSAGNASYAEPEENSGLAEYDDLDVTNPQASPTV